MMSTELPAHWLAWRTSRIEELIDDGMEQPAAENFAAAETLARCDIERIVGLDQALAAAMKSLPTPYGRVIVYLDLGSTPIPPEHQAEAARMTEESQRIIRSATAH